MRIILTEKPSVARHIAAFLGESGRGDGYIETKAGRVTWAVGHLLESPKPDGYDPALKAWRMDTLPFVPEPFRYEPNADGKTKAQLKVICGLLKGATEVVIATDAGPEGEMIGWEILDYARFKGPVKRLWATSQTQEALAAAWRNLKEGSETKPFYFSSKARSEADWLVGMNISRAVSLRHSQGQGDVLSVGRVQTPTLALIVRRDREIRNFRPQDYFEVIAEVQSEGHHLKMKYAPPKDQRIFEKAYAENLARDAKGAQGALEVKTERKASAPPALFSLTDLSKAANVKWGWSAKHTLEIAQALYEKHKVTTYPRTDSNYLEESHKAAVPGIIAALRKLPHVRGFFDNHFDAKPNLRPSVFNTKKCQESDHHAIIPTELVADLSAMTEEERLAYQLIAERFLGALSPGYEYDRTVIRLPAAGVVFEASGNIPKVPGWKLVGDAGRDYKEAGSGADLPPVRNGAGAVIEDAAVEKKVTEPPSHYTEATLLDAMNSVAKYTDDPKLKALLNERSGIGTVATRPDILERLKKMAFIEVQKKKILATSKGVRLVEILEKGFGHLIDPVETARWEDCLKGIQRKTLSAEEFKAKIVEQVSGVVAKLKEGYRARAPGTSADGTPAPVGAPTGQKDPSTGQDLMDFGGYWQSKGGPRFFKEQCKRKFTIEEALQVLGSKEAVKFAGFVSKAGNPFSAGLQVQPDGKWKKVALVFEDRKK